MNLFDTILNIEPLELPEAPADLISAEKSALMVKLESSSMQETEPIKHVIELAARIRVDQSELKRARQEASDNPGSQLTRRFPDHKRGLALVGGVGCGKTIAMRALCKLTGAAYCSVPDMALDYSLSGAEKLTDFLEKNKSVDIVFDDLGAERTVKSFGNNFPMMEIMLRRYDLWQRTGVRMHFTSNLNGKELKPVYGDRVLDRIHEMCDVKAIKAGSMR